MPKAKSLNSGKKAFPDNNKKSLLKKFLFVYALLISFVAVYSVSRWQHWKKEAKETGRRYRTVYIPPTPTLTPTPSLDEKKAECVKKKTTLFTGPFDDSREARPFAACLEDGVYRVYRKNIDGEYVSFYEETGRYEDGEMTLISYADYDNRGRVPRRLEGSRVFIIKKGETPSLAVLFDHLAVPNKESWIWGVRYSVQYWIPENEWLLSPDKDILLLYVTSCTGCSTSYNLYAYKFSTQKLKHIGELYGNSNDSVEWLNANTVKWTEGRWRKPTDEEYEAGQDFPAVHENLGTRTTRI